MVVLTAYVSALGMSKLFLSTDERLRNVVVKGDMIITESQRNSELHVACSVTKLMSSDHDPVKDQERLAITCYA